MGKGGVSAGLCGIWNVPDDSPPAADLWLPRPAAWAHLPLVKLPVYD